jgi:dihydroflavonol-4-reductase
MHLITGASGLVGSHLLIRLLKDGEKVRALYRSQESKDRTNSNFELHGEETLVLFEKIDWIKGDVLDLISLEEALEGVDYVYHCAAIVSFKKSDKEILYKTNIEGTKNLVNACLSSHIKKLCHVSSTAAIGKGFEQDVANEELPWKKEKYTSNYSISKYHAEMEVWRGIEEGLSAVIINPSIILGPADWNRGSAELFTKVWKGLKYYTLGMNAFVDVRDVVSCMASLMKSNIAGERFLVCSENLSYQELFNLIAKYLGKQKPSVHVKKWMLGLAWRLDAIKSFLFKGPSLITRETANSSMSIRTYSNDKIIQAINFQFIPVEESIKNTAKLFLKSVSRNQKNEISA